MNLNLLSVAENAAFYSEKFAPGSSEAVGKAVSYGLPFSLFGFLVVFGVLDNGSVVAAIMAAISAFRSANGEGTSFRVVSFKKRK